MTSPSASRLSSVNLGMLGRGLVSAGAFGSHGHAHQAGAKHAAVEQIAFLHDFYDRTVGILVRFHALDGFVIVRIELSCRRRRCAPGRAWTACPRDADRSARRPCDIRRTPGCRASAARARKPSSTGSKSCSSRPDAAAALRPCARARPLAIVVEIGLAANQRLESVLPFRPTSARTPRPKQSRRAPARTWRRRVARQRIGRAGRSESRSGRPGPRPCFSCLRK